MDKKKLSAGRRNLDSGVCSSIYFFLSGTFENLACENSPLFSLLAATGVQPGWTSAPQRQNSILMKQNLSGIWSAALLENRMENTPLKLVCFVFPIKVPRELDPLSSHKLCVHMHVNKTKFARHSSLEYYHMTCIGKAKHTR